MITILFLSLLSPNFYSSICYLPTFIPQSLISQLLSILSSTGARKD